MLTDEDFIYLDDLLKIRRYQVPSRWSDYESELRRRLESLSFDVEAMRQSLTQWESIAANNAEEVHRLERLIRLDSDTGLRREHTELKLRLRTLGERGETDPVVIAMEVLHCLIRRVKNTQAVSRIDSTILYLQGHTAKSLGLSDD